MSNLQSDLKIICRENKSTVFPSKRYIIPRNWFDNIMNNSHNAINSNNKFSINNSQFLNSSLNDLNNNVDERKIVLIIYELMNYIHNSFSIDYIIQANISLGKDKKIYIDEIQVFNINEFNKVNVPLDKNITPVPINDTYLKYPCFQILKKSNNSDLISNEIISKNTEKKNIEEIQITSSNTNYNFEESMSSCCFNLDLYKKISLNPLGLKNPSVYCYMNCCLQILLSIPELNYYFLNKRYNKNEQGNNNRTLICNDYSDFISLYQYYINHKQNQMDLPRSMFEICNNLVPKNVMNDCEEFLILFLQSIQEELNYNSNQNNINNNRNINNNNDDKNDIQKRWCLYRERNSSFMDSVFTGYLRSTVICEKCNKSSYSYEPFMDLSVPVPKTNKSINKCLNRYFEAESIDCNYHCDNCKNYTKVSHKILINNLIYLY